MTTLNNTTEISIDEIMEISIDALPIFIKKTELYRSMVEDEKTELDTITKNFIPIPYLYCKSDLIIKNMNDFIHIFHTCNYWGIIDLPFEIYDYIHKNRLMLKNNLIFIKNKLNDFELFKECYVFITLLFDEDGIKNIDLCGDILCLKIIKFFHIYKGYVFNNFLKINDILKNNYIKCLEYIYKNENNILYNSLLLTAITYDSVYCLEYLVNCGLFLNDKLLYDACTYDSVKCLEYLISNGSFLDDTVFIFSVEYGSIKCLQYLYENNYHSMCIDCSHMNGCYRNDNLFNTAIGGDNVECVKYLHNIGILPNYECFNYAIKKHSIKCLKYLYENELFNEKSSYHILAFEIKPDDLEIVSYLRENGIPWSDNTFYRTIVGGNMECIEYLHKNNCPYSNYMCLFLGCIKKNNIECFKYLYENSFLFDSYKLMYNVIKYGDIKFFKYLDINGFELNDIIYRNIVRLKRNDIIIYLQKNKHISCDIILDEYKKLDDSWNFDKVFHGYCEIDSKKKVKEVKKNSLYIKMSYTKKSDSDSDTCCKKKVIKKNLKIDYVLDTCCKKIEFDSDSDSDDY
jgi:hypothetical protein